MKTVAASKQASPLLSHTIRFDALMPSERLSQGRAQLKIELPFGQDMDTFEQQRKLKNLSCITPRLRTSTHLPTAKLT